MTLDTFNQAWTADRRTFDWVDASPRFAWPSDHEVAEGDAERWRGIVDLLLGWRSDPSRLIAEDIEPPQIAVIDHALRVCDAWRRAPYTPPDRVLPDAEGGLAFEWYREPWFSDLEFERDGRATWRVYSDSRPIERGHFFWKPQ